MIAEGYPKGMEMPMVYWPWHKKGWDFPVKMDRSLSIYLPSQLVDCIGQASCIQGPKSRKNQVEWYRSPDSYNHQWKILWASWQFWRWCYLMNHQISRGVVDVFRWWVSTNSESTKQWVDPELTRAWNGILLRWSWLRIKGEVRETKSEWGSERADALSWIRLVAV